MNRALLTSYGLIALLLLGAAPAPSFDQQADNPNPPQEIVKLIFIHHSTGENWLTDGYGDLGQTLDRNNYFVSDTNYGWGPDSIGDRTDIPNWTEWFASAGTPAYMNALFNENQQNSSYTRTLSDPGGENQIIMFKSCFPNSALEGSPNDPPGDYEELSVSGAKYAYNTILEYFATRPDKLFIVITAPPLSDPAYAENARAFNQWLVDDWLRENNYTLHNVAVFDFYNILTGPEAHHRFNNGTIEHVIGNSNTLYYPSGDDHPSEQGSRKATEEFASLLNVIYHRWQADVPPPSQSEAGIPGPTDSQPGDVPAQPAAASLIDDFESGNPPGTNGWEPFWDETTPTSMHCAAEAGSVNSGQRALLLDFDVASTAWATCALFFESPQNWSTAEGLTFYLHSAQPGSIMDVDIYVGSPEAQETYLYTIKAPAECANGWVPISLNWSDFHRADWEENAGTPFARQDKVIGMAFGLGAYEGTTNTGQLWVDDLSLMGSGISPAGPDTAQPSAPEGPRGGFLPCGGALVLPMMLAVFTLQRKRRPYA